MNRTVIYIICLFTAIALLVGSFFVPPMGIIDASILKACSIILGFYLLYDFPNAITAFEKFKISKGDFTMEGEKHKKEQE